VPHPAIVLISHDHLDVLEQQFSRYAQEYDIRGCRSALEAYHCMLELRESGSQVALFVVESVLPDATVYEAVHKMRKLVPTARRVVVAHR
jgi:thioredoxin reductase (NADPH)